MTSRRRTSLRLARRLVRRSPGRSALIVLLVAIPVLTGTFAAVTIRTSRLSATEAADRELGRADAIVQVTTYDRLDPWASQLGRSNGGDSISSLGPLSSHDGVRSATRTGWADELPAGSRITALRWTAGLRLSSSTKSASVLGVVLDLHDPITSGMFEIDSGHVTGATDGVALTGHLARRAGVEVGDRITLSAGGTSRPTTVEALVTDPRELSADEVVTGPDSEAGKLVAQDAGYLEWLVDTPAAPPDLHDRLAATGVIYETRGQWMNPAPALQAETRIDLQILVVLGTVTGFGLLEIVLLAGAAFAVGARRQTHELGLLAAVGGDETDVRRTVVGQGLVLGVLGAAAGVVAGAVGTVALRPVLERVADRRFGAFDAAVGDLVALAVIGVLAGYLAAVIPARAASRRPVVDMLKERFSSSDATARVPRWATAALVLGPALVVVSAYMWHQRLGDFARSYVAISSPTDVARGLGVLLRENFWPTGIWVGTTATLAGMVRACPAVIASAGGLARHLPLTARLALRDAARHRHRTAPATAAVMTVVAGAVVVLFVLSSTDLRDRSNYHELTPVGTIAVNSNNEDPDLLAAATRRVVDEFGGRATTLSIATTADPNADPGLLVQDPACVGHPSRCAGGALGVVELDGLAGILGPAAPEARMVLAAGGAVYPCPDFAETGRLRVLDVSNGRRAPVVTTLDRTYVPPRDDLICGLPEALISTGTAAEHGWTSRPLQSTVTPSTTPTQAAVDRLQRQLGDSAGLRLETGYQSRYSAALLALSGAAALATLVGTSIAVALAMAESRADMATLAAVGAPPGRRRLHAMGQAGVVSVIGGAMGLALGAFIAVATLAGSALYPTSTPFRWLAVLVVVSVAVAVGVAGLCTRSRVPLTRRLA